MANLSRFPATSADSWDWQLKAACRGEDPNTFFHPMNERTTARARRIEAAKVVCNSCPVKNECADHAFRVQEPYGVWGGLSEEERAKILRGGGQVGEGVTLIR